MPIDLRTLMLMNLITNLVALVVMGILWAQYRNRYQGLGYWLVNMGFQALSIILFVLRGRVPDFASIVLANLSVQIGAWLILVGLQRFFGLSRSQWFNIALLCAFALFFTHAAIVVPNLNTRNLLLTACMAILMAEVAWLMLVRISVMGRSATRLTGLVALSYVVINCARFAIHLFSPNPNNDFFRSAGLVDIVSLLAYLTLAILLVLALVLLVNQRLLDDVRAQEDKFSKAFHAAPYAVLLSRMADGRIFEVNQGFEEITGFKRDEVLQRTMSELNLWASPEARRAFMGSLAQDDQVRNMEAEFRKKDGTPLVCVVFAETILIGAEECVISCIGDVTEQFRMREQLEELASHDALTGLPNRRLFYDRFEVALANAIRNEKKLAVISLDLDNFKEINDAYGHEVGDMVLAEASRRLTSSLRKVDTVARFGGDEFVLLLWEIQGPDDAAEVAAKVLACFKELSVVSGHELSFHASLGIALYPDDGTDLTTLLRKSDEALYFVKAHGRDGYRFASRG